MGRPDRSNTHGWIQYDDRVQMIRHYLQLFQSRTKVMSRYRVPPVQYDPSRIIQFQHRVRACASDATEYVTTAACAQRYEIRTARVVAVPQAWVFVEDRRHVVGTW